MVTKNFKFSLFALSVVVFILSLPAFGMDAGVADLLRIFGALLFGAAAPLDWLASWPSKRRARIARRTVDGAFEGAIARPLKPVSEVSVPRFIAVDIEGCITPADRAEVDLRKFQRLRSYSALVKRDPTYPQLVIFTGRSQGYVELLAQSLGMIHTNLGLPFVIENGSALYFPLDKRTEVLVNSKHLDKVGEMRNLMREEFGHLKFEPKSYMITVNPPYAQESADLHQDIAGLARDRGLLQDLRISHTASAVDVTGAGVSKLTGLMAVSRLHDSSKKGDLAGVVAMGDTQSDIEIFMEVGKGYCPAENVADELVRVVMTRWDSDHVVAGRHIDFVIKTIEKVCYVELV